MFTVTTSKNDEVISVRNYPTIEAAERKAALDAIYGKEAVITREGRTIKVFVPNH